jgi:hypothetical protein
MSPDHNTLDETSWIQSEKIDLGLEIPAHFDAGSVLSIDRLLGLHPNWFISNLGLDESSFTADIKDYATEETSNLSGSVTFNNKGEKRIGIRLSGTLDICIEFLRLNGSLTVQTRSPKPIDPADPVLLWIRAILQYLRLYVKKTPATLFFRLLMNRMILTMNPSQRKICMMLAKITLVEVFVIILILVGYKIFVL